MDSLIKLAATTISRITGLVTVFIWGSSENYKISLKAGSRGVAYRIQHSSRQQSPSSEFSGSVLPLGPRKCLCCPIQTLKPKTIYVWGVNGEQRRDVILEIFVLLLFLSARRALLCFLFSSCVICEISPLRPFFWVFFLPLLPYNKSKFPRVPSSSLEFPRVPSSSLDKCT